MLNLAKKTGLLSSSLIFLYPAVPPANKHGVIIAQPYDIVICTSLGSAAHIDAAIQYINTPAMYLIMILCTMNIKVLKWL